MFNIIIFGPPGSGKGTQSVKIAEKYNLKHVSTGDILRKEVREQTDLGIQVKNIIEKGELVPDELLIKILHSVIENNEEVTGFIFDGFPRTVIQAEALDTLMEELKDDINAVVSLNVSDEEVVSRLLKRAEIEGRKDDNKETIANRLSVYNNQTSPLLNYYDKKGKLVGINGIGTIDGIFKEICNKLD